jgi:hypothetical protein
MKLGRVIGFVIAVLLCVGGVTVYVMNVKSDAAIAAEAESYVPKCNGEEMAPGESCLRVGGDGTTQTYDEMKAAETPDKVRSQYAARRLTGIILVAGGALLAGLLVLRIRRVGRRPAKPLAR